MIKQGSLNIPEEVDTVVDYIHQVNKKIVRCTLWNHGDKCLLPLSAQ